jgi:hypothetical protein
MSKYSLETRNRIISDLRLLGVAKIVIDYSGSGDEGAIDTVAAFMDEENDSYDAQINLTTLLREQCSNEVLVIAVRDRMLGLAKQNSLEEQLTELAYDLLEHLDVGDWVNNDGGQGKITILVNQEGENPNALGIIEVEHGENVIETVDSLYEL